MAFSNQQIRILRLNSLEKLSLNCNNVTKWQYCQDNWKEIIPEKESVLDWIACVRGDLLVTCYTEDCVNKLYIHQLESGALVQAVEIPPGSIVGYSGRIQDSFVSLLDDPEGFSGTAWQICWYLLAAVNPAGW